MVELRDQLGAAHADAPLVVARGDDHLLARDGLVALGFRPGGRRLLDGAPARRPRT